MDYVYEYSILFFEGSYSKKIQIVSFAPNFNVFVKFGNFLEKSNPEGQGLEVEEWSLEGTSFILH